MIQSNCRMSFVATLSLLLTIASGRIGANPEESPLGKSLATEAWTPTGGLVRAREYHTATLLGDGRVLAVGGYSGTTFLASAEIFDPQTGIWEETSPLDTARAFHTATLLPTGEVLVVGGETLGGFTDSVELFDPRTGAFRSVAPLASPRSEHTATLLATGWVLVAGGQGSGTPSSAAVYDPANDRWIFTGPMRAGRHQHTATRLSSSHVLVVGSGSAEIYDPQTFIWRATAPPPFVRNQPTATLMPSGKVIVAGGYPRDEPQVAQFDPTEETWTALSPLPTTRSDHGAVLLPSGLLLLAGGGNDVTASLLETQVFDETTGAWATGPPLPIALTRHSLTLLATGDVLLAGGDGPGGSSDRAWVLHGAEATVGIWPSIHEARATHVASVLPSGRVLVAGGYQGTTAADPATTAEVFDPETPGWTTIESPYLARGQYAATLLRDGRLFLSGGTYVLLHADGSGLFETAPMNSLGEVAAAATLPDGRVLLTSGSASQIFDPSANQWSAVEPLPEPRGRPSLTALADGRLLMAGGINGAYLSSADLYDPTTGIWTRVARMQTARDRHTATLLPSGKVLVAGGWNGTALASAELYDPATNRWQSTGSLVQARRHAAAVLLPTGKVLVVGGDNSGTTFATTEIFDPATGRFSSGPTLASPRQRHTVTMLPSGEVLVAGGLNGTTPLTTVERITASQVAASRRPQLLSMPPELRFGVALEFQGVGFAGGSEGSSGGNLAQSDAGLPSLLLQSLDGTRRLRLGGIFGPTHLEVADLPAELDPGWYAVAITVAGVDSPTRSIELPCHLTIVEQPNPQHAPIGGTATFRVRGAGARAITWRKNGTEIEGARGESYATPPLTAGDDGSRYSAVLQNGCTAVVSEEAVLSIEDTTPPFVDVVSPDGGEYWFLSPADGEPHLEPVSWSVSDNVRVCRVEVELLASFDGGQTYTPTPAGDFPATLGSAPGCVPPGVSEATLLVEVPTSPPGGQTGGLYKIRVTATDQAGLRSQTSSFRPFSIVTTNPEAVETLILTHSGRFDADAETLDLLSFSLEQLATHPSVQGLVVDLDRYPSLSDPTTGLYAAWDGSPSDPLAANRLLFAAGGVQGILRTLLTRYPQVRFLLLVGADHVVPFARVPDGATLLPESSYLGDGGLSPVSPVGAALAADLYLSDDPLAIRDPLTPELASAWNLLPDLAVGRLVESPHEIIDAVSTFLAQNGVVSLDPAGVPSPLALVSGYDFLLDGARRVESRWRSRLGGGSATVDAELSGQGWDEADLLLHLCGIDGTPARVLGLHGHGTHHQEGTPGSSPLDIRGLSATTLVGSAACGHASLSLGGSVIYAVGCHGGLSVADGAGGTLPLDLPQAALSRGAGAYLANAGYGWGLLSGVGYSERLMELFTDELTAAPSTAVGEAARRAKLNYLLENPRFDPYDAKTLAQWTLFGFPMLRVTLGSEAAVRSGPTFSDQPPAPAALVRTVEQDGALLTWRLPDPAAVASATTPPHLLVARLTLDLTAEGLYRKYAADGRLVSGGLGTGCPTPPPGGAPGCYYALNGATTSETDLPLMPYLVLNSRVSSTSQHGVLFKGGAYRLDRPWVPIFGALASNGGDSSNHGVAPEVIMLPPTGGGTTLGENPPQCRVSDLELNSVIVTTAELTSSGLAPHDELRLYELVDLELLYFNDNSQPLANCDRSGPELEPAGPTGDLHQLSGTTLEWAVGATDEAGVWRVLVVYDDGSLDEQGRGQWRSVDLADDGSGVFRGGVEVSAEGLLRYVVQAVDRRGNVTWWQGEAAEHSPGSAPDGQAADLPASGVPLGLPRVEELTVSFGAADLTLTGFVTPNPAPAGSTLIVRLVATNSGPDEAGGTTPHCLSWSWREPGGRGRCRLGLYEPRRRPRVQRRSALGGWRIPAAGDRSGHDPVFGHDDPGFPRREPGPRSGAARQRALPTGRDPACADLGSLASPPAADQRSGAGRAASLPARRVQRRPRGRSGSDRADGSPGRDRRAHLELPA